MSIGWKKPHVYLFPGGMSDPGVGHPISYKTVERPASKNESHRSGSDGKALVSDVRQELWANGPFSSDLQSSPDCKNTWSEKN